MNMIRNRFTVGLAAGCIAAASGVLVTTIGYAQSPLAASTEHHGMRGPHGKDGGPGRMMREAERLKTSLRLTAPQAALWDRAAAQMSPAGGREAMKSRRDRMTSMLDDPAFDPRMLVADMERQDAERKSRMVASRDAWLAVWDGLDTTQRGQVREFLRGRLTRRG